MNEMSDSLLAADEPAPVTVHNENDGLSPFLIVADHGGNVIPRSLRGLGVSEAERQRHIAWDIGIAAASRLVADALDATLVQQNYSRLVIDCNRAPGSEESIPDISELIRVPGNIGLNEGGKAARVREIFRPYHDRIESELDRRRKAGRPAALIAMHSFTPVFMGVARPWHAGVLYNRDPRFAHLFVALLKREEALVVGNNEPYDVNDATDYTIPVHGERRGLHHVAIEIRQDLIVVTRGSAPGLRCSRACCRRRIRSWWQPKRSGPRELMCESDWPELSGPGGMFVESLVLTPAWGRRSWSV